MIALFQATLPLLSVALFACLLINSSAEDKADSDLFCYNVPKYVMEFQEYEEELLLMSRPAPPKFLGYVKEKEDERKSLLFPHADPIKASPPQSRRLRRSVQPKRHTESDLFLARLKKRVQRTEPWICPETFVHKDLGPDFYPDVMTGVECSGECFHGRFGCQAGTPVQIRVLRRISPDCPQLDERTLRAIEKFRIEPFSPGWEWTYVYVVKHCECKFF